MNEQVGSKSSHLGIFRLTDPSGRDPTCQSISHLRMLRLRLHYCQVHRPFTEAYERTEDTRYAVNVVDQIVVRF